MQKYAWLLCSSILVTIDLERNPFIYLIFISVCKILKILFFPFKRRFKYSKNLKNSICAVCIRIQLCTSLSKFKRQYGKVIKIWILQCTTDLPIKQINRPINRYRLINQYCWLHKYQYPIGIGSADYKGLYRLISSIY